MQRVSPSRALLYAFIILPNLGHPSLLPNNLVILERFMYRCPGAISEKNIDQHTTKSPTPSTITYPQCSRASSLSPLSTISTKHQSHPLGCEHLPAKSNFRIQGPRIELLERHIWRRVPSRGSRRSCGLGCLNWRSDHRLRVPGLKRVEPKV